MARSEQLLNHFYLKNRVKELGMKQWWIAEQIGVDRKTVVRWIQGQVKAIQTENAHQLSRVLDCSIENLIVSNPAEQFASAEDQKIAAAHLLNSSLIGKLGPLGEWSVIESLLKATFVENLPLQVLGELYNQMSIACWRQNKMEHAEQYNLKVLEIGNQLKDQKLIAAGLMTQANLYSWRGQTMDSISTYQRVLAMSLDLDHKTRASAYSNLGGVFYESGNLEMGRSMVQKSIATFQHFGKPMNLSIAHTHLALIALQSEDIEAAQTEVGLSVTYAQADDYRRGLAIGKLIQAEILARKTQKQSAMALAEEGLRDFESMKIFEGLNYEIAGRTHRLCGDFDKALSILEKGKAISTQFPMDQAGVLVELAKVQKLVGYPDWIQVLESAIEIYERCQCPLRVQDLRKML